MPDDQKAPPKLPVDPHKEAKFPPPSGSTQPEPPPVKPDKTTRSRKAVAEAAVVGSTLKSTAAKPYAEQDRDEKWQTLVKALQANRRRLLSIPGVTAVDLGYKIEGGSFKDELALRIHVERKLPDETKTTVFEKRPYDFFPKVDEPNKDLYFRLNGDYDVPTDVIEGTYRPAQLTAPPRPGLALEKPQDSENVNRRRRLNPLVGGISIGSPQTPSGTLGALVWDNTDGSVCILSNWHVLSGDLRAEAGTPCFQPGRLDQGKASDEVARLKRWSFDYQTDAAIAELTGSRHYCAGEILSLYQQITGEAPPHLGMLVQKVGRSTGFTWGFIDGLYFSAAIKYSDGIVQVFEDQIHIAPVPSDDPEQPTSRISEPGDSGSVWIFKTETEGYKAVGLHFAGDLPQSAFGDYALANPMSIVAQRLNLSFRPRFLEIRDEDVVSSPTLQIQQNGTGVRPIGIIGSGRLTGQGGQPDPIRSGST